MDESTDNLEGSTLNPMEVEVIILEVLKYIQSFILRDHRTISKKWNAVSKIVLRKRRDMAIKLGIDVDDSEELLQYLKSHPKGFFLPVVVWDYDNKTYEKKLAEEEEEYIWRSYDVNREICGILSQRNILKELAIDWPTENFVLANRFFNGFFLSLLQKVSGSLEILNILSLSPFTINAASTVDSSHRKLEMLARNLRGGTFSVADEPELKMTSLREIILPEKMYLKEEEGTGNWIERILKHSTKLTSVEDKGTPIVKYLKDSGRLAGIQKLECPYPDAEGLELLLQTEDLKLQHFSVDFVEEELTSKIEMLLGKQKKHLKFLSLGSLSKTLLENDERKMATFKMPRMPQLGSLELFHFKNKCGLFPQGLNFKRDTPKLESINVDIPLTGGNWQEYFSHDENDDGGGFYEGRHVENVTLFHPFSDPNLAIYLGKIFPSVKKLQMNYTSKQFFQEVLKCWENLEILSLHFNKHSEVGKLDQLLFGIVQVPFPPTVEKNVEGWWKAFPEPELEQPNISNLKGLKRLIINCDKVDFENLLTDGSVFYGILKLKKLVELNISSGRISYDSFSGTKAIVDNLPQFKTLELGSYYRDSQVRNFYTHVSCYDGENLDIC